MHLCVAFVVVFSSPVSVLYFVPPFSFQPFQMFTSVFNERSSPTPCHLRPRDTPHTPCATPQSGALSAWTFAHPTQVMSPRTWSSQAPLSSTTQPPATSTSRTNSIDYTAPLSDPYIDDDELGKLLAVVVDRTGGTCGKER